MSTFTIRGGRPLSGSISVSSGKNAPIALLFASLAVRDVVIFEDMSRVHEVEKALELFSGVGVKYEWIGNSTLKIDTGGELNLKAMNRDICERMRICLLFFGALANRAKSYRVPMSGGCKLGERSIRPHVYALQALGISVTEKNSYYEVDKKPLKKKKNREVIMYEAGDTPTENAVIAAALTPGVTTIKFASANYMVQEVCNFLVAAGAKISGIGTTTLVITGVEKLHSVQSYFIMPDPVDAMAWISLAVTTKSKITVKNCAWDFLALEMEHLAVMGQKYAVSNRRMSKNGKYELVDITLKPSVLKALPDKLHGRPYPGFNIDNVPLFVPILTQAKGRTLVHDWVFENRAIYYLELQKLGAEVLLLDPHRAIIEGPRELKGNEVICPPGLRPGMAILIAMIAAKGTSVLRHALPIERGYEKIVERLRGVGVNIERSDE